MTTHTPTPRPPTHRSAFTLIEILVVISIIGLLVGLVVVGARMLMQQGETEKSKAIVNSFAGVLTQYQAELKRVPRWMGGYANDRDTSNAADYAASIEFLHVSLSQVKSTSSFLQGINREFIANKDNDTATTTPSYGGGDEIVDAWGVPLRYSKYQAGPTGADTDDWYGDPAAGLPQQKRPYVASAGPDQEWGRIDPDTNLPATSGANWDNNGDGVPDAADNIYSFDVN